MVAIKNSEADRFLAKPPAHVFLYLVFGSDAGLVAERVQTILSHSVEDRRDPFQLLRIGGDDLAADPLRLADEANTVPLFGGRRAIHIDAGTKPLLAALEPVLALPPRDCTIVIAAGALKKEAALRKLCEREKNAAAIECYPDSADDLARLIEAEAAAAGLSIAPDIKAHLVALLGEDRLVTRSELEKLTLYARGDREIGLHHIEAIVADAAASRVDPALDAAFSGNFAALEAGARQVLSETGGVNLLLAAAATHALALHRARLSIEMRDGETASADDGFRASPPFGGFKRKEMFESHLRAFTAARLEAVIATLAEAAASARREAKLAEPIVVRALWKVASIARQGRAAARGHR